MTPEKWQRMQKVFDEALNVPATERTIFVHDRCQGDPSLETYVLRLLEANDTADRLLDAPTANLLGFLGKHEEARSFTPGSLIANRFEILRFLNRGGMGEVYEAWDSELKERVALKAVRPEIAFDANVLERFKREVKQARGISHPNVCRIHELFSHEVGPKSRTWFLSMEFLEGVTLSDYIRHHGPMEPDAAFELVEQIVSGLVAAHDLGVIHRDFKTSNVMLVSPGPGRLRAVITDFGLALNVLGPREGFREPGGQGTPDFMAPEQKETGEVTSRADQYALGVVLCEMLTGSRPIRGEDSHSGAKSSLTLPAGIPAPRWRRVVLQCLETRPENRFERTEDVLKPLTSRKRFRANLIWTAAPALLLACLFGAWYVSRPDMRATSIAVLPLQNRTGDAKLDYMGAGISEALTDDLSRMPDLQVTAENVARRYSGDSVDPRRVGRDLRVTSVVDGSITIQNEVLRVPIELIDVRTGHQVWGQIYERSLSKLTDLQHEISTDVAYRLKIKLDVDAQARLKRQYSTNPSTYNSYLQGRFHLGQRSPDALRKAIDDFQRAIDQDSQYAPAYAGLADCYNLLAYYGVEAPIPLFMKARAASQRALELDSTLGEAYTSRALARTFLDFDWQGAEADYKRAIELNSNYLTAHTWYGLALLTPLGRRAEAAAQLAYAQASDPDSLVTTASLATMNYFAGNVDRSIALMEPRVHTTPSFEPGFQILALDYLANNLNEEVIALLESSSLQQEIQFQRAIPLGIAYARTGQRAKALAELKIAQVTVQDGHFLSYETAQLYTALNNHPKALSMLELAYARRESNLVFLDVDPLMAPLRTEPRFLKLLGLMNMRQILSEGK